MEIYLNKIQDKYSPSCAELAEFNDLADLYLPSDGCCGGSPKSLPSSLNVSLSLWKFGSDLNGSLSLESRNPSCSRRSDNRSRLSRNLSYTRLARDRLLSPEGGDREDLLRGD